MKAMPSTPMRVRASTMLVGLVVAIFGVLLVVFAFYLNFSEINALEASKQVQLKAIPSGTPTDPDPNATVTCNNVPMTLNEVCDHILTINGSSTKTTYSYTEQQVYQHQARIDKIERDRAQQRSAIQSQKRPDFSIPACLSPLACLGGIFVAVVGLASIVSGARGRTARQASNASESPTVVDAD